MQVLMVLRFKKSGRYDLWQWFSKYVPWASDISITWKFVRNIYSFLIYIFPKFWMIDNLTVENNLIVTFIFWLHHAAGGILVHRPGNQNYAPCIRSTESFFFKFYFIFKLYNIVLVLPNIEMNPPQVYLCSPS